MKKNQSKFFALFAMLWLGTALVVHGSEFGEVQNLGDSTVWNVDGSTGDQYLAGNRSLCNGWINFWVYSTKNNKTPPQCLSEQPHPKCSVCDNESDVGGHVVLNTNQIKAVHGENYVYIVPLCSEHNNHYKTGPNYPMTLKSNINAVRLNNYHIHN